MTATDKTPHASSELVPIADRMRYLQGFRVVVALGVVVFAIVEGHSFAASLAVVGLATGAWLLLSVVTTAAWRVSRRGGLALFGFMLMADGVYLAWASYASGGAGSPVRYLIVLHLIAVALLASYRTGMKLALWHTLLLLVVYYAQRGGLLRPLSADHGGLGIGTPMEQLIGFTVAFWFVTIATASFSAVNERELRRRRYDLEALAGMATRISETTDSTGVASNLLASVIDVFDFERGVLVVCPSDDEYDVIRHGEGTLPEPAGTPAPEGSALARAMSKRETQLVSSLDPEADAWLDAVLPGGRNLVLAPLSSERRAMGVLVVEHGLRRGSRIERRVVGTLERFVDYGAVALRNAWLLNQVQRLAVTDPLTGVANRLRFQVVLEEELERAARGRQEMTLAMLDVDHFKTVNDSRGHQAGDDVLRELATRITEDCRMYDTLARYGGEEFALILPNTGATEAFALGERMRRVVEDSGLDVTISVGLATFPADGTTSDSLTGAADLALYESKRGGRNRVTAARRSPDPAQLLQA